jgi:hypothetical protein
MKVPHKLSFEPEDLIPNSVFSPEGGTLSEEEYQKVGDAKRWLEDVRRPDGQIHIEELCRACGWTTEHELGSSYLPRLRILHSRGNSGLWFMGNDWLIWDHPKTKITNDYMTYKFLRDQGTKDIPLVKEMYQFGQGDQHQFTVMSRAKGMRLEDIWASLTDKEKRGYADQMIAALRELRQFTAPTPQRVDGSPLWDSVIGRCGTSTMCKTIPATREEWIEGLSKELKASIAINLETEDEAAIEAELRKMSADFPESAPFVLTHGDLDLSNIIVHDGKIEAIIDWEYAGYYPWWVERLRTYTGGNSDELFNMVWPAVDGMPHSPEEWAKIQDCLIHFQDTYTYAPIEHPHNFDVWLRPKWCECKPYGGFVRKLEWVAEFEHMVLKEEVQKEWDRELAPK